jgi:hypothetical protein
MSTFKKLTTAIGLMAGLATGAFAEESRYVPIITVSDLEPNETGFDVVTYTVQGAYETAQSTERGCIALANTFIPQKLVSENLLETRDDLTGTKGFLTPDGINVEIKCVEMTQNEENTLVALFAVLQQPTTLEPRVYNLDSGNSFGLPAGSYTLEQTMASFNFPFGNNMSDKILTTGTINRGVLGLNQ